MQNVQDSYGQEQKRGRGNPNWSVAKPYSEVREIIKSHNFKSIKQYRLWVLELKSQGKGSGFPLNPQQVYLRKGEWISREDFLGLSEKKKSKNYIVKSQSKAQSIPFWSIRTIIKQILGLGREKVSV